MAYRHSIASRAKLLYQEERLACSFTYIRHHNNNDDQRRNRSSVAERPKIPNFLRNTYFTSGGINRWSCSRGLFQDPRFSFASQQYIGPMIYGFSFSRNMSTSVDEGAVDKIEYMTDMADVLTDKSVEVASAVVQALPVVDEVAVAAADSYFPVAALQYLIDYVHTFTGLDWWASIALTTLLIRSLTVPLLINQLKSTSRLTLLRPRLEEVKEEMQNRGMSPSAVHEGQQRMKELFKEYGVTPFTPLKGILFQGPVFVSFFLAINNMVEKVPSFKQGGALWFTDLTTPDSMYILPILTALTFWITVECNMQEGMEGNPAAHTIKNVSRVFAALTIPLTATFAKGIFCYWITSNMFSLMYGFVIKKPAVKKAVGIPIIPMTPPPLIGEQKPTFSFFEGLKKYVAAQAEAQRQQAVSSPSEAPKPASHRVPSSSLMSQRLRSLEKEVKGRKKGKKK